MEKNLSEFKIGEKGIIRKVDALGKIKRRLFDMGITPGATIMLKKVSPLGDPIEVTIRGYELSLRRDEASSVIVEAL
ncbi:ferrous iron transport protein A [bacterium]|nr:ferrous iron transport protein A [bacterium]